MQDEIGDERLLERRREPLDELVRQPADEPDRVGQEVLPALVVERARGGVERLEEPVVDRGLSARERVQQRRLADVRVAGEGDGRRLRAHARLPALLAPLRQPAEAVLQQRDPPPRQPAVGLELALARAPRADAAAEPLEVLPHAAHAREVVLELRELDLELALARDGVLREDVEDQLRPVDDARVQGVFESPLLRRRELAVDDEHLRARVVERRLQLLELPLAHVRARVRLRPVLNELADGVDARGPGQLVKLGELRGLMGREQTRDREPALRLRAGQRIGLVIRHGDIMR